jgi:lycopene beta-cyclase
MLADGSELRARVVVDGRGPGAFRASGRIAYQKFLGLELVVRRLAHDAVPIIMDATVPQHDGFRFFYVLPLSEERVLIEETYFSDSPKLEAETLRAHIIEYAALRGLGATAIAREERGVLPLPTRMPPPGSARSPFLAGFAGGWFHPTTGYSFPVAARLAELFALHEPEDLPAAWARIQHEHAKQARFCAFLNRLLYGYFAPEDRWNVLERFYRLPAPTIRRFYALNTSSLDRARILCGRPPAGMSLRYATANADRRQGVTA